MDHIIEKYFLIPAKRTRHEPLEYRLYLDKYAQICDVFGRAFFKREDNEGNEFYIEPITLEFSKALPKIHIY